MGFYRFLRPLLFLLDPETAHSLVLSLGRAATRTHVIGILRRFFAVESARLAMTVLDLDFENPVGLAAGFDKNGELIDFFESLGFGFIEIGSVTNLPSPGNSKPRLFRLAADRALINRMGLNNVGPAKLVANLDRQRLDIPVGINIAKTNRPDLFEQNAIDDMVSCYQSISYAADYSVLNVSCPNSKDGRTFEEPSSLKALLDEIYRARSRMDTHEPLLVKFSPDMPLNVLETALAVCESAGIRGYVISNTSISRDGLRTPADKLEAIGRGGLSGKPITEKALERVSFVFRAVGRKKPIIGLGGIESAETAYRFIRAGASLIQIYTGLIYQGPLICKRINLGLLDCLKRDGLRHIREAVGTSA